MPKSGERIDTKESGREFKTQLRTFVSESEIECKSAALDCSWVVFGGGVIPELRDHSAVPHRSPIVLLGGCSGCRNS